MFPDIWNWNRWGGWESRREREENERETQTDTRRKQSWKPEGSWLYLFLKACDFLGIYKIAQYP